MVDVTSWFQEKLEHQTLEPLRRFTIGNSDYSSRVVTWPTFKREAHAIKSGKLLIELANQDKALNNFYVQKYTAQTSVEVAIGFTHPTSGDEYLPLFSGMFRDVLYADEKAQIECRDNYWEFVTRTIGEPGNTITFSHEIPSDILWTLCTCYGDLDSTQGSNNVNIDWNSFNALAAVFSQDHVLCSAEYDGEKLSTVLNKFSRYTDIALWIEGDGKINFKKFTEASSLDMLATENHFTDFQFKMEGTRIVNTAHVFFNYDVSTGTWLDTIIAQNTPSVNSYGLFEEIFQEMSIWYVDSVSALTLAHRKINMLHEPPRRFEVKSSLIGTHRKLGDTIRLNNDFYSVNSSQSWAITALKIDLNKCQNLREMDEAKVANAFTLDVSTLDGSHLLL